MHPAWPLLPRREETSVQMRSLSGTQAICGKTKKRPKPGHEHPWVLPAQERGGGQILAAPPRPGHAPLGPVTLHTESPPSPVLGGTEVGRTWTITHHTS